METCWLKWIQPKIQRILLDSKRCWGKAELHLLRFQLHRSTISLWTGARADGSLDPSCRRSGKDAFIHYANHMIRTDKIWCIDIRFDSYDVSILYLYVSIILISNKDIGTYMYVNFMIYTCSSLTYILQPFFEWGLVPVLVVLPFPTCASATTKNALPRCQTGVLEKVIVIPPLTSFSAKCVISGIFVPIWKMILRKNLDLQGTQPSSRKTWLKWLVKLYKIAAFFMIYIYNAWCSWSDVCPDFRTIRDSCNTWSVCEGIQFMSGFDSISSVLRRVCSKNLGKKISHVL